MLERRLTLRSITQLNLMANHGYISRSGITNFNELVYGQQEAMGFGADLAVFLAALGTCDCTLALAPCPDCTPIQA